MQALAGIFFSRSLLCIKYSDFRVLKMLLTHECISCILHITVAFGLNQHSLTYDLVVSSLM